MFQDLEVAPSEASLVVLSEALVVHSNLSQESSVRRRKVGVGSWVFGLLGDKGLEDLLVIAHELVVVNANLQVTGVPLNVVAVPGSVVPAVS